MCMYTQHIYFPFIISTLYLLLTACAEEYLKASVQTSNCSAVNQTCFYDNASINATNLTMGVASAALELKSPSDEFFQ